MIMANKSEKLTSSKPSWSLRRNETISLSNMDFPSLNEIMARSKEPESNKVISKQTYSDKLKENTQKHTKFDGRSNYNRNNEKSPFQNSKVISNTNITHFCNPNPPASLLSSKEEFASEGTSIKTKFQNLEVKNRPYSSTEKAQTLGGPKAASDKNSNKFQQNSKKFTNIPNSHLAEAKFSVHTHETNFEDNSSTTRQIANQKVKYNSRVNFSQFNGRNIRRTSGEYSPISKTPSYENFNFPINPYKTIASRPTGMDLTSNQTNKTSDEGYTQVLYRKHKDKSVYHNSENVANSFQTKQLLKDNVNDNVYKNRRNSETSKPENVKSSFSNHAYTSHEKYQKVPYENFNSNKSKYVDQIRNYKETSASASHFALNSSYHYNADSDVESKNKSKNNLFSRNTLQYQNQKIKSDHKDSINANMKQDVGLTETKKTKKRKSKVKRQVALQTGKISILTPEMHLKILNQSGKIKSNVVNAEWSVTNINDKEEYPELGMALANKNIKENSVRNISDVPVLSESCELKKEKQDTSISAVSELVSPENNTVEGFTRKEAEIEKSVHTKDPITLSISDILLAAKTKKKEIEEKVETKEASSPSFATMKMIKNKVFSKPVNPLDSSRLTVKRGKESEKPKIKKPSKMRKVILAGRKLRADRITAIDFGNQTIKTDHSTDSFTEESLSSFKLANFDKTQNPAKLADVLKRYLARNNISGIRSQSSLGIKRYNSDSFLNKSFTSEVHSSSLVPDSSLLNIYSSLPCLCTWKEDFFSSDSTKYFCSLPLKTMVTHCGSENMTTNSKFVENCTKDKETLLLNRQNLSNNSKEISINPKQIFLVPDSLSILGILKKSESALSETVEVNKSGNKSVEVFEKNGIHINDLSNHQNAEFPKATFSDKQRMDVVKILLHSNKYRDYCNHLVSKELDSAVDALVDDLARFQDRMHQKEPLKAKMKRRLIYGIKEIKKHLKVKKLKCVIIATDIENIKIEGGLNELILEIIHLAEAYHIPYIFSHRRCKLGKICRKPSPVSCVGILNYEGSEKNYKNILELHERSKSDYEEITKKIEKELTDNHIQQVYQVVEKLPYTPYDFFRSIVKEFFASYLFDESEHHNPPMTDSTIPYTPDLPSIMAPKIETTSLSSKNTSNSKPKAQGKETEEQFKKIQYILEKYNIIIK